MFHVFLKKRAGETLYRIRIVEHRLTRSTFYTFFFNAYKILSSFDIKIFVNYTKNFKTPHNLFLNFLNYSN